jgi:GH35 family endo-1,4-beta-xylanase
MYQSTSSLTASIRARRRFILVWSVSCLGLLELVSPALSQTITGTGMAFRSSGAASGSDWMLSENGYVGTYIKLDAPGDVTVTAQASGQAGGGVDPNMNIVIADTKAGFDVASGFNSYSHTFSLPAGTYFVRTEFNNDVPTSDRRLTVRDLTFSGATVENTTTQTTNDGYALAAGDTYINNFRKGNAQVTVNGVRPGSPVRAQLTQHAFNFGTQVGGTFVGGGGNTFDVNTYLNNTNYTNFLTKYFNTITQGNAGKWDSDEATRNVVTMQASDRIDQFAIDHNMRVRQHNLIWGSQQPSWVNTMLNSPNSTDALTGMTNKNALRQEVSQRIDYYIGNNDAVTTDDRAAKYNMFEMDLLNEEVHQPKYWSIYGASGIADIFNEAAAAVTGAGANTRLALNEYNVLQFGSDAYGNWYRHDVESIANAGGAISAIGVQYYPTHASGTNDHSPARITQTLENLAVTGLPISLTEFGVQANNSSVGGGAPTPALASQYLTDTMRLTFGNPDVTTFDMWGFWANDIWNQAPYAALRNADWSPTVAGNDFEALMGQWSTDTTVPVAADGTVNFNGFYGKYQLSVGVYKATMSFDKGTGQYSVNFNIGAGDFNFDGVVNAADYTIWKDTLGSTTDLRADANGDGMVDDADYQAWVNNFGTVYVASGAGASNSAAVPEPTGVALLTIGGLTLVAGRCRRKYAKNV